MAGSALSHNSVTAMQGATASAVVWRALGRLHVTAVAKATFGFADEAFMPRLDPDKILTAEVHHGKNPGRSVRFTSDLAPHLARADVMFTGFAHARPGGPVRSLPVRLAIESGDRVILDRRLLVQDASGFQRLSLTYEHAWGGIDCPENPLGMGATPGSGEPNVVDPALPRSPASFAPVGRLWPARKRLLGTASRKAIEAPIAEIPDGFDFSYFQAAPPAQRIDYLRGDEWVVLEGLHPTLERVRMHLPRVAGHARVYGLGASGVPEGQRMPLNADTLRIDGDAQRCSVVLRASFVVPDEEALGRLQITAGVESWGEPIVWRPPPAWTTRPPPPEPSSGITSAEEDAPTVLDSSDSEATVLREGAPVKRDISEGGTLLMGSAPGSLSIPGLVSKP
jgi:hypothetical protein